MTVTYPVCSLKRFALAAVGIWIILLFYLSGSLLVISSKGRWITSEITRYRRNTHIYIFQIFSPFTTDHNYYRATIIGQWCIAGAIRKSNRGFKQASETKRSAARVAEAKAKHDAVRWHCSCSLIVIFSKSRSLLSLTAYNMFIDISSCCTVTQLAFFNHAKYMQMFNFRFLVGNWKI